MAISTYAELKSAIADFLNRDDLTSAIPNFVSLAEADMNRRIRHWRMEQRSTASIDGRYTALPSGYLEAIRFHLDADERPIEIENPSNMQKHRMRNADVTGAPRYYSVTGGEIEVWPTPDMSYTGELCYYARLDPLSDVAPSNWVLQYFPDTYLYGSLVHSAPYLSDDQRAALWASLYQQAVDGINNNSESAKYSGSGLRMRVSAY